MCLRVGAFCLTGRGFGDKMAKKRRRGSAFLFPTPERGRRGLEAALDREKDTMHDRPRSRWEEMPARVRPLYARNE